MIRAAAFLTGLVLIAAATHASIVAGGGYVGSTWPVQSALGLGLVVGAACVGRAWSQSAFLALVMGAALVAGEAFALLSTGERIIAQRDAALAPYRAAVAAHEKAAAAVKAAIIAVPTTTPRLTAAESALTKATDAVSAAAAEKHCAANCRALLEQAVSAARGDIDAARREFDAERNKAIGAVETAKKALAATPLPTRPEGLAERINIGPWALDLIAAALASLAVNGLGATLIAFGAHRGAQRVEVIVPPMSAATVAGPDTVAAAAPRPAPPQVEVQWSQSSAFDGPTVKHQAARFICGTLRRHPAGRVSIPELEAAVSDWLRTSGETRMPGLPAAIGALLKETGAELVNGEIIGAQLARPLEIGRAA